MDNKKAKFVSFLPSNWNEPGAQPLQWTGDAAEFFSVVHHHLRGGVKHVSPVAPVPSQKPAEAPVMFVEKKTGKPHCLQQSYSHCTAPMTCAQATSDTSSLPCKAAIRHALPLAHWPMLRLLQAHATSSRMGLLLSFLCWQSSRP